MTKENHQVTAFAFAKSKAEKEIADVQTKVQQAEERHQRRIVLDELAVGIPTNQLHKYELVKKG